MVPTKTSIFLFFLILATSSIRGEEQEERRAQLSRTQTSQHENRLRQALTILNSLPEFKNMWSIDVGSQDIQENNVNSESAGENVVYGSQDVQIGNIYPDNPNGTNVYGSIVIQKNNTYPRRNKNAHYGPIVMQLGNVYPKNPGKNDIYTGVVIQEGNTYQENSGDETIPGMNIKNNRGSEIGFAEHNATNSQSSTDFVPKLKNKRSFHEANSSTNLNRNGPTNYLSSRLTQENNVYSGSAGKNVVYGSQDVQIGNIYPDNPNGTNVYGPIVIQKNNTYRGKNKNAVYGAIVTQFGNVYPKNPGNNDIYTAVVVQEGNTYE